MQVRHESDHSRVGPLLGKSRQVVHARNRSPIARGNVRSQGDSLCRELAHPCSEPSVGNDPSRHPLDQVFLA